LAIVVHVAGISATIVIQCRALGFELQFPATAIIDKLVVVFPADFRIAAIYVKFHPNLVGSFELTILS
jgi:hypothetical protein